MQIRPTFIYRKCWPKMGVGLVRDIDCKINFIRPFKFWTKWGSIYQCLIGSLFAASSFFFDSICDCKMMGKSDKEKVILIAPRIWKGESLFVDRISTLGILVIIHYEGLLIELKQEGLFHLFIGGVFQNTESLKYWNRFWNWNKSLI